MPEETTTYYKMSYDFERARTGTYGSSETPTTESFSQVLTWQAQMEASTTAEYTNFVYYRAIVDPGAIAEWEVYTP